jgi:hypothetical protein
MIKEAIEKVLALDGTINTVAINGRDYAKSKLVRVDLPEENMPTIAVFSTLTGLQQFAGILKPPIANEELFFHVENPAKVSLVGALQPQNYNRRFIYGTAEVEHETFIFSLRARPCWYSLELFIVALQSLFVPTDSLKSIIDVVGNLANENIQENKDDGFSQTLQVRSGISSRSRVKIENPVRLMPWRTFREVQQPISEFVLRFSKDKEGIKASLWEADGGVWRFFAMQSVGAWLNEKTTIPVFA